MISNSVAFLLKSTVPSSVGFQMWKAAANIVSIVPTKEMDQCDNPTWSPEMFCSQCSSPSGRWNGPDVFTQAATASKARVRCEKRKAKC